MTKFTPVLPSGLYTALSPRGTGNWHFLHAPQVADPRGPAIVKLLRTQSAMVILDCFAYELGGGDPDTAMVYEAASVLSGVPMIIVCPDVVREPVPTMELLRQHGPALAGLGRLMIVPHGRGMLEWMHRADVMLDFCSNHGILSPLVGIPRYMTDYGIDCRKRLAAWIAAYYPSLGVHLLGAGSGIYEVMAASQVPNVVSCDSTSPFACVMSAHDPRDSLDNKYEMDPRWWHQTELLPEDILMVQLAISMWKELLEYG